MCGSFWGLEESVTTFSLRIFEFFFFDILVLLLMNAVSFACKSWVFFHLLTDPRVMVGILLHCGVKTEESAVMYCHTVSKLKRNDEI